MLLLITGELSMKPFHLFLSILLLFVFGSTNFAAEPIRVLTFNILCAGWEPEPKKDYAWEKRLPIVVDVMKNVTDGNGPYDFIGTQETSNNPAKPAFHQVKQIADAMTGYGSLFAPCNGKLDKFSLSNMILWKKDRWEIDPNDSGFQVHQMFRVPMIGLKKIVAENEMLLTVFSMKSAPTDGQVKKFISSIHILTFLLKLPDYVPQF
jgi:hypothetical protein